AVVVLAGRYVATGTRRIDLMHFRQLALAALPREARKVARYPARRPIAHRMNREDAQRADRRITIPEAERLQVGIDQSRRRSAMRFESATHTAAIETRGSVIVEKPAIGNQVVHHRLSHSDVRDALRFAERLT